MKVRLKPAAANRGNIRGWLLPEQEYVVLSVEMLGGDESGYRIATSDNATPALFETSLFDVTNESAPDVWINVRQGESRLVQQMPASWSVEGFWEAFFDGDPVARKTYDEAVTELVAGS